MLLTCPECETQYKLNQAMLGGKGRKVRCTSCFHVWFQNPDGTTGPVPDGMNDFEPVEITAPPPHPLPAEADLLEEISGKSFAETLQEENAARNIPDVVKPRGAGFEVPVTEYRPMGMGAGQFGFFAFLLFSFITLSLLFAFKKQIVYRVPATAMLYEKIGMHVAAPGEGLRLSELQAENTIDRGDKKLAVSAKLANMTEGDIAYPPLRVTLKGPYGAVLKEWDLRADPGKTIPAGQAVPVSAAFGDAPEAGAVVELKVIK